MKQGSLWLVGPDCLSQETESSGAHQRHQKKKRVLGVLFTVNLLRSGQVRSGLFHDPTLLQCLLGPALNYPIVPLLLELLFSAESNVCHYALF